MKYSLKEMKADSLDTKIIFTNFHPLNDGLDSLVKYFLTFCHGSTNLTIENIQRILLNYDKISFSSHLFKNDETIEVPSSTKINSFDINDFSEDTDKKKVKIVYRASKKFISTQTAILQGIASNFKISTNKINDVWFDGFTEEEHLSELEKVSLAKKAIDKNIKIIVNFLEQAEKREFAPYRRPDKNIFIQIKAILNFLVTEIEIGYTGSEHQKKIILGAIDKVEDIELDKITKNKVKEGNSNLSDLKKYVLCLTSEILTLHGSKKMTAKALYDKIRKNYKHGTHAKNSLDILNKLSGAKFKS